MASAATACIVAMTCEYKSKVMPIWLWPSRSLTILGCTPSLVLATTVHRLRGVHAPLPEAIHDFRVDLIATRDEAIWCAEPHRPPGILWDHLHQDKIAKALRRPSNRP